MLEAFENNYSLEAVNLSNNNITEQLSENLRNLFCSPASVLKYINLADNYINDECLENIEVTEHLTALVLRNNSIKSEGAISILNLLHRNDSIRRVDLSKNMVSIKYLMEISKLIDQKREKRAVTKIQNVRNEIIDLKEDLKTIVDVQRETKNVMAEKVSAPPNPLGQTATAVLRRKGRQKPKNQGGERSVEGS